MLVIRFAPIRHQRSLASILAKHFNRKAARKAVTLPLEKRYFRGDRKHRNFVNRLLFPQIDFNPSRRVRRFELATMITQALATVESVRLGKTLALSERRLDISIQGTNSRTDPAGKAVRKTIIRGQLRQSQELKRNEENRQAP